MSLDSRKLPSALEGHPLRRRALYLLFALSFVGLFHANVVLQWMTPPARTVWTKPYYVVAEYGRRLGLAATWRMYSPTPRLLKVAEWYALSPEGEWVEVEMPNLGPRHRSRRNAPLSWLRDFKLARAHDEYLYDLGDAGKQRSYVAWHLPEIERRLGWRPLALRVELKQARIPGPRSKTDWTPYNAPLATFDTIEVAP
ncbi:MAG: hypothetical protein GY716_00305 [bacterium]|nr:hypothetical protein [bacterium]